MILEIFQKLSLEKEKHSPFRHKWPHRSMPVCVINEASEGRYEWSIDWATSFWNQWIEHPLMCRPSEHHDPEGCVRVVPLEDAWEVSRVKGRPYGGHTITGCYDSPCFVRLWPVPDTSRYLLGATVYLDNTAFSGMGRQNQAYHLAHAFGHCLGLGHETEPVSIMYPNVSVAPPRLTQRERGLLQEEYLDLIPKTA